MNKQNKIITLLAFALLAIGGFVLLRPTESKIKTDPTFFEIKGKVIEGFPVDFPVYPGSILEGSANVNPANTPDQGYRVKWEIEPTQASIPEIMRWYEKELESAGWKYTPPDDYESPGEQVAYIEKEGVELKGYIAAESENGHIEIIVDVRKD